MMKDNIIKIDWDDEILAGTVLTHGGEMKDHTAHPRADSDSGDHTANAKPAAKVA
jgi:NAD(P) transhydrogenase subunit alpha